MIFAIAVIKAYYDRKYKLLRLKVGDLVIIKLYEGYRLNIDVPRKLSP